MYKKDTLKEEYTEFCQSRQQKESSQVNKLNYVLADVREELIGPPFGHAQPISWKTGSIYSWHRL